MRVSRRARARSVPALSAASVSPRRRSGPRWRPDSGTSPYEPIERELVAQPPIAVPAVTLDGTADGNFPATDGRASAHHFTGPRVHHQVPDAGHNLPQEAPEAFARAVLQLSTLR